MMRPSLSFLFASPSFRLTRRARLALLAVPLGVGLGFGCGSSKGSTTSGFGASGSTMGTQATSGPGGTGGNIFGMTTSSSSESSSSSGGGAPPVCDMGTPTKGPVQWALKNTEMSGVQNATAVTTDASGNVLVAGATGSSTSITFGSLPPVAASGDANNAFVAKFGPTGTPTWSKGMVATGSATSNGVIGSGLLAVTTDASANVYVGGYFNGTLTVDSQSITGVPSDHVFPNAFVAKLEPTMGTVQELLRFGNSTTAPANGGGAAQVQGLATHTTSTGAVLAIGGKFESELDLTIYSGGTLLQTESSGDNQFVGFLVVQRVADSSIVFSAQLGDGGNQGQEVNGVAFDSSGNVYVTGDTTCPVMLPGGTMLMPMGTPSAFVAKISADGSTTMWSNVYGDTTAIGAGIAVDASGDVFVAGQFTGSIDFGGGALTTPGGTQAFVAKLDTNGKEVWAHHYGSNLTAQANGIALDSAGRAVVTGTFTGSIDFGTTKLMGNMNFNDIFLAKLDTHGCQYWAQAFGDTGDHSSNGVAVDTMGNSVIAGHISGTPTMATMTDFGTGPLTVPASSNPNTSIENAFVAKFGP